MDDPKVLAERFAEPFDPEMVKAKPQSISGNRALAVRFVDARVVMDRLDEVVGVLGWQDSYECLPDGAVICRLKVKVGGEWITKEDVGGQSEQPDEGDRRKAAFSDALKRAAVKFGIGRYLYRIPNEWCDYDPQKRRFIRKPTLPPFAIPGNKTPHNQEPAPEPTSREQAKATTEAARRERYGDRPQTNGSHPAPAETDTPTTVYDRVRSLQNKLVEGGKCKPGALANYLKDKLGWKYSGLIKEWPESSADDVTAACKAFQQLCREQSAAPPEAVTVEHLDQLEAELERTGQSWQRVTDFLKVPASTTASDLSVRLWQEAMDALGEMPSKQ